MSTYKDRHSFWSAIRRNDDTCVRRLLGLDPLLLNDRVEPNGYTALMEAASLGCLFVAQELINHGATVNIFGKCRRTFRYFTALHLAAGQGRVAMVNLLLDNGADINLPDPEGYTPLMMSLMFGYIACATNLLQRTPAPDMSLVNTHGDSALTLAALVGPPNMLQLLLNHNADISHQNNEGYTAIMISAQNDLADCVRFLQQTGSVDVNATNNRGDTALMVAAETGHMRSLNELLPHYRNINKQNNEGSTALILTACNGFIDCARALRQSQADLFSTCNQGDQAFMKAASNGHNDVMEYLLDEANNAHIDHQNTRRESALILAAFYNHQNCVNSLLQRGASPHLLCQNGHNALMYAAAPGHITVVETLLDLNVINIDEGNIAGRTALMISSKYGRLECVKRLLRRGANRDAIDIEGDTALIHAASEGRVEVVEYLVARGANIDQQNLTVDHTPLMRAALQGHADCVRSLVQLGANQDITDRAGSAAVMLAAMYGHVKCVEHLLGGNQLHIYNAMCLAFMEGKTRVVAFFLDRDLDVNIRLVQNNWTGLMLAAQNGHYECVTYLLERGANPYLQDSAGRTAKELAVLSRHFDVAAPLHRAEANARSLKSSSRLKIDSLLPKPVPKAVYHSLEDQLPPVMMSYIKFKDMIR